MHLIPACQALGTDLGLQELFLGLVLPEGGEEQRIMSTKS